MTNDGKMESIHFVGVVSSPLITLSDCPLQESEGAPQASITINSEYEGALSGLKKGDQIIILTWLNKGNRSTLVTHPRNDTLAKVKGVFATRSPDRPNPIGLHEVEIVEINGGQLIVSNLEVLNGTPVIDIKPVL